MPSRRKNIRQRNKILLMFRPRRQLQCIKIRIRNSQILCLTTSIRTHRHIPIRTTRKPRIHMRTEPQISFPPNSGKYAVLPSSQFIQRPQATLNGITTLSPFFKSPTPSPVSSTIPKFSCPKIKPCSAAVRPS